jgi:NAD(P)H-hydrate epimerase
MSLVFLSRDEVRALDRRAIEEYGMPGAVLMENAGRGAAEVLRSLGIHGKVVVCCGKGNNGGDGFVMARHLDNWHVPVCVLLFGRPEDLAGDAALNYRVIARAGLPIESYPGKDVDQTKLTQELAVAEWIVDGLFGTGLAGAVRAPFDSIIRCINASPARVLALDIPSGLDCDTGTPTEPTVRATHTVTFAALKKGFTSAGAKPWLGKVHLVEIGVPCVLLKTPEAGVS